MNTSEEARLDINSSVMWNAPYFIGLGRAMVSLGPLSSVRYCSYSCRFCYVQGPFPKYKSATSTEIVGWLAERRELYDIVYVSGDTDSFARPRTDKGLDLLEALLRLNVDVLFTTRYVFAERELERLKAIAARYRAQKLLLIGCISISQLHHPELEPVPIESPQRRVGLLREMQQMGIITALTIRPFIPSISASEYCDIAKLGAEFADVILGGDLYLDSEGSIMREIQSAAADLDFHQLESRAGMLDFSLGFEDWLTLTHGEAAAEVSAFCESISKPFFMRSGGGISWIRERRSTFLS